MRVLSLFSGIGGLDLGLERAGMTVVGQVEIDPFCRAVLAKHWPNVKQMADVREVKGDEFGPVDLVCGGVPCQPASCAGKRKGASDERWMWGEFVRVVRGSGCAWFLAENVRGFLSLREALGVVGELERAGFEVRTLLLGAHHVGAPHRRDRIWIVGRLVNAGSAARERDARGLPAEKTRKRGARQLNGNLPLGPEHASPGGGCEVMAHPTLGGLGADGSASGRAGHADQRGAVVADAAGREREVERVASGSGRSKWSENNAGGAWTRWPSRPGEPQHEWEAPRLVYAERNARRSRDGEQERGSQGGTSAGGKAGRESESGLGVSTHGLPRRLAGFARRCSLKALGNAVVPQVAEVIGTAIMESPHA